MFYIFLVLLGMIYLMFNLLKKGKKIILDLDDDIFNAPEHSSYLKNIPMQERIYVVNLFKEFLSEVSAISVTTQPLKNLYKQYNKNVFILPNCVDTLYWDKIRHSINIIGHSRLHIGYQGSFSHLYDIKLIEPVMKEMFKKHKIELTIWGFPLQYIPDGWDKMNVNNFGFGSFGTFFSTLWRMNFDLMLCPLENTKFNKGKSSIKIFESAMCFAPVVASDIEPYKWLPDAFKAKRLKDWIYKVDRLLSLGRHGLNEKAADLRDIIVGNFDIRQHIYKWKGIYENL